MSSNPTRLAPLLTTSVRLPSGVIATATGKAGGGVATAAVGWVATDTEPTDFTFLPSIASTLTESSARLATSANVPARLIAMPEACLPASTVAIWTGGDGVRRANRKYSRQKNCPIFFFKLLKRLVPRVGFEPTAYRL